MLFTSMLSFFDSVEHSHPPFRHRLRSRRNGQSGIQTRRLQDRPSRRKQTSKESSSRSNLYRDLRQTRRTWNAFVSCLASSPIIHVSLEKNFDKIGTGALTFSGNSNVLVLRNVNAHSHLWGFCSGLRQLRDRNFSIYLRNPDFSI